MDINIKSTPKNFGKDFLLGTGIPVLLFLGALSVVLLLVLPTYKKAKPKSEELSKLIVREKNLDTKIMKLNDLLDFKDVVNEDLKLVNIALPSEDNIPLLLTEIQKISKEAGLAITNLSYSAQSKDPGKETSVVNVTLSGKGSFNEVKTFLKTLEKASRLINVSTLRFSSVKGTDPDTLGTSELEISLGLNSSYLFVDSKAVPEEPITVDVRDSSFVTFMNKLKEYKIYDTTVDNSNIGKDNPFNPE